MVLNSEGADYGWDVDNVRFEGLANTPFTASVFDAGKCGTGPRGPAAAKAGNVGFSGIQSLVSLVSIAS